MVANSKAIKSLLDFLANRGNDKLRNDIESVHELVHDKVFGAVVEEPLVYSITPVPKDLSKLMVTEVKDK